MSILPRIYFAHETPNIDGQRILSESTNARRQEFNPLVFSVLPKKL